MRSKKKNEEIDLSLVQNAYLNYSIEDLANETWLKMKGQEQYFISNIGRVKKISLERESKIIEQILTKGSDIPKFMINRDWYNTCEVVANTYKTPNPLGLKAVGHINGVKTDNRPENLEYCEINSDDIISPYVLCDWNKLLGASASRIPVAKLTPYGTRIAAYLSIDEASRECGLTHQEIIKIVKERKMDKGFYWINLQHYMHLSNFVKQARIITEKQKKNHPWLL